MGCLDREEELERELARFDWHDLNYERPIFGELVIATDGVARWMDMFVKGCEIMRWEDHIATHWHAVREMPQKKNTVAKKTDDAEVVF